MTSLTHSLRRRIAFAEADPAGVAHFTALLQIVEEAEHDWMRANGVEILAPGTAWPRVALQVDFHAPAGFGEEVRVDISVSKTGRSSVTWAFTITRMDDGKPVAGGSMTTCHVTLREEDGQWIPQELPEIFRIN